MVLVVLERLKEWTKFILISWALRMLWRYKICFITNFLMKLVLHLLIHTIFWWWFFDPIMLCGYELTSSVSEWFRWSKKLEVSCFEGWLFLKVSRWWWMLQWIIKPAILYITKNSYQLWLKEVYAFDACHELIPRTQWFTSQIMKILNLLAIFFHQHSRSDRWEKFDV